MRELTDHKVNHANDVLTVRVMDEPGSGGACHAYLISGFDNTANPSDPDDQDPDTCLVLFQNGPMSRLHGRPKLTQPGSRSRRGLSAHCSGASKHAAER